MTDYFFDTSALIKRYLREISSKWVRSIARSPLHSRKIAYGNTVELHSILARQQKGRSLTPLRANRIRGLYLNQLAIADGYVQFPIDDSILISASNLALKHQLRALDSIQLASAVAASSLMNTPYIFVTSDKELLQAEQAEKFTIDDPPSSSIERKS